MSNEVRISSERENELKNRIKQFRFFDDTFFRVCMKDNYDAAKLILGILLQKKDIEVTEIETQRDMKNLRGRSSVFDFVCNVDKKPCDVEMQRADDGAEPERARYHSSLLDCDILKPQEDFSKILDTYVIFVTENDYFGYGDPYYLIERTIIGKNKKFNDRSHIIYVNGAYDGNDEFGRLMHDFRCTEPRDMYYDPLKNTAIYFKENEKGVKRMCELMENFRQEDLDEDRLEQIKNIATNMKVSYKQVIDSMKLTPEEKTKYLEALTGEKLQPA